MEKAVFRRIGCTVYEGRTDIGLDYMILPSPGCQRQTFAIVVGKGGAPDEESIDGTRIPLGTAHFLEHRMFQLEDGDAEEQFAALGCYCNAVTSTTSTAYYFSVDKGGQWERGLELLAKMCTTFFMSEEDVDRERKIILQERQRTLDDPDYILFDELLHAMYFHSPIREDIIGTPESLEAIHTSALRKFFRRHYTPGNMVLFALGDLDPVEVAAKIEKLKLYNGFAALDAVRAKIPEEDRTRVREKDVTLPSPDGQTYLGVGIKFPTRESLYNKFGDLLFAMYEILPEAVFSPILKPIDEARQKGLLIRLDGVDIHQAGEDACLIATFETNAPGKLRAALDKHLDTVYSSLSLFGRELKAIRLAYLGEASLTVQEPESLLSEVINGYENHVAWPALASRACTAGTNDMLSLLKELSQWPRSYVTLTGARKDE